MISCHRSSVDAMWKDEIVDLITGYPTSALGLSWAATRIHMLVPSFRSYLNIYIPSHGISLTRALTGKRRDILTKETFPEAVPSRTDSNGTQETGILAEETND